MNDQINKQFDNIISDLEGSGLYITENNRGCGMSLFSIYLAQQMRLMGINPIHCNAQIGSPYKYFNIDTFVNNALESNKKKHRKSQ